jgi:hypothetical protein
VGVTQVVLAVAAIVVPGYLLWRQNQILKQANEIAAQEKNDMRAEGVGNRRIDRYWPMIVMAVLTALVYLAVGYDVYHRRNRSYVALAAQWAEQRKNLPVVIDADLTDKTIRIDGHKYVNCKLDNTTLLYEGKQPVVLQDCNVHVHSGSSLRVQSDNEVVRQAFSLMAVLNSLSQASGAKVECQQSNEPLDFVLP